MNFNFLVVFLEGVLSLLSPCVLPIIPVYVAILSGSYGQEEDKKPIINTVLFILGISTTFFILGSSINYFSNFLIDKKETMNIVGGILIILMGLFFMGVLKLPGASLGSKKKSEVQTREMGPLTAFLLGFTFSWGWSPCVGPMLTSAIIMASNTGSRFEGNIMILVYTLGFIVPFLLIAIFYDKLAHHLDKLNRHGDKIKKIGGILLIITGISMATGNMDKFLGNVNKEPSLGGQIEKDKLEEEEKESEGKKEEDEKLPAIDFSLEDQYGEIHKLSDYRGKLVFINFWASWCGPCVSELPDLEKLYEKRGKNQEDVVVIGIAAPNMGDEGDKEHIKKFLKDKNISYPVVFDETGEVFQNYRINSFPNSFIIDKDGNVEGYIPGAIPLETMEAVVDQVLDK